MSRPPPKQKSLTSFFGAGTGCDPAARKSTKRRGSRFGTCPVCEASFPYHQLELHASNCNGKEPVAARNTKIQLIKKRPLPTSSLSVSQSTTTSTLVSIRKHPLDIESTSEPIPGLFLYENFITEEEEQHILFQLDGTDVNFAAEFLPWKPANFNGSHLGKRWGVHCNLRDRRVGAAENPLPHFVTDIMLPKLSHVRAMKGCTPNEANAIDYRRYQGHHLTSHVDDRKLSKEPIANISMVGDCYMTFRNVAPNRNTAVTVQKVLLKRRCLQILTGKARYDFSHGIEHSDLLSDRRVSVTMRESPLTENTVNDVLSNTVESSQLWWKVPAVRSKGTNDNKSIDSDVEPIPGLFLFTNFITEEEESLILKELDGSKPNWSMERHTGSHREKRWGVDHDLWSRELRPPKHALPDFMHTILIPRLKLLAAMKDCVPNDANAIEYRRALGDSLAAHLDDRQKHKEPIANLSLAGDCYMTFRNVAPGRNTAVPVQRVLLRRRCLQVLTGKARYDFTHGIAKEDLISDRRVSVTMRETPFAG
jgi:alkylated DNA repair dioxygenase AlkB